MTADRDYVHVRIRRSIYLRIIDYCKKSMKISNPSFSDCLEHLLNKIEQLEKN